MRALSCLSHIRYLRHTCTLALAFSLALARVVVREDTGHRCLRCWGQRSVTPLTETMGGGGERSLPVSLDLLASAH